MGPAAREQHKVWNLFLPIRDQSEFMDCANVRTPARLAELEEAVEAPAGGSGARRRFGLRVVA